jgi:hypothetical protein
MYLKKGSNLGTMPVSRELAPVLFICTLLAGCVDPYYPEIEDNQGSLVVEALITDQPGWQVIYLSRSSMVNERGPRPETDAYVSVSDDLGRSTEFIEQGPGAYHAWMTPEKLGSGITCRLNIVTSDGEVYESEPEMFPSPSPAIDSVYWKFEPLGTSDRTESLNGIRFYLDLEAEADQGRNFRWELVETWEYQAANIIDYFYDGILHEWPDQFIYHTCWYTGKIDQIYTATTRNAESNIIKGFALNYVSEETNRLQIKYSLQVVQYSLNDEAYDFWKRIEEQNQESGGIYERQPDYISGNMYNMNNQEEYVLGFFNLCPVSEKRIFVDGIRELHYPAIDCTLDTIMHPLSKPVWMKIPFFLISFDPLKTGPPYGVGTDLCFDCRNGGGNIIKPDSWE